MSEAQADYLAHHPTGMSKFPALAQCPFFEGDDRPGKLADEGSEAHRLLSLAMGGEPCPAESPHHGAVCWAAGFAQELEHQNGMKFDTERRVAMKSELPYVNGVFGTCDLCMVHPERVVVVDFKTFGTGEKCHLEQLAGYAFALGCEHGIADPGTACELYALHGAVKRYDKTVMTLGDCHALAVSILAGVAFRTDAERCANDYCRYCKHYGACDAQKAMVSAVAPVPNMNLLTATRDGMLARPQDIPVMLVLIKELETLIDRAKENAAEAIKAHGQHGTFTCDGVELSAWTLADEAHGVAWQIKQSPGNRKFESIPWLWDFASEHISQEDFLKCCSVNVGKLTKEITARSGISLKEVNGELDKYAVRGEIRETMKRVK